MQKKLKRHTGSLLWNYTRTAIMVLQRKKKRRMSWVSRRLERLMPCWAMRSNDGCMTGTRIMLEEAGDTEKQETASSKQLRLHSKPTGQTLERTIYWGATCVVTFMGKQVPLNAILQKYIDCDAKRLKCPKIIPIICWPSILERNTPGPFWQHC